jgi:hypothetical protein
MNAIIVLMAIILILLVVIVWMIYELGKDMWLMQCNSDKQYVEVLDTIYKSLEGEDKILKTIKEWSEKNG